MSCKMTVKKILLIIHIQDFWYSDPTDRTRRTTTWLEAQENCLTQVKSFGHDVMTAMMIQPHE